MKVYLTLWFKDFRKRDLVREVSDGGFDGIELSLDYPMCGYTELKDIPQLEDLVKLGLEVAVHMPWREVYLASPVEEIRKMSVDYVIKCLEESRSVNPTYAVLHLVTDQAVCTDNADLCVTAALRSLGQLSETARRIGVPLYVETTRNYCCGGLEHSVIYMEHGTMLCLDIPHAIERYSRLRKKPVSLSEILLDAPPKALEAVECVHLHGYVMAGHYIVESHIEPSRELLGEYLGILRKKALRPKYTVLESFYSTAEKRLIRYSELRWCVDELKKNRSRNR